MGSVPPQKVMTVSGTPKPLAQRFCYTQNSDFIYTYKMWSIENLTTVFLFLPKVLNRWLIEPSRKPVAGEEAATIDSMEEKLLQ